MGGRLNWLPCRRHREEKQKAKEDARRQAEKAKEDARREEERKAKDEARREKEKNDANPPKTGTEPDATTEAPEPEKPSAVEQTTPSPTPSIHQDVWNDAYESIAKDDPKLVESYMKALKASLRPKGAPASEDPDVSAEMNNPAKRQETMLKLVASGREKVAKSAKFTERVGKFANGVLQCKGLVDLAIQNVPQAALPWAGVCIGLQILCNPAKESSSNLEGIAHVTSRMDWYCTMAEHILRKENMELGNESYESVLGQLRGRMVELYKALLLYQMRSTCSYYRAKGLNFLRGLANMDDWESQLQSVKNAEDSLKQDSGHYNKEYTKNAMGKLVSQSEETHNILGSIHQTLQDYISMQKTSQMDSERNGCLQALRLVDPKDTIGKIEGIRDTVLREAYEWILDTKEYRDFVEWTDKQKNRVLWVHGPAGTGKTMLSIGMIREMEAVPAIAAPSMSFFFCEKDDDKINNPTAVLRSLIWLLLIQQPHLFSHILEDYKSSGADKFRDANAFWSLKRIFKDMLQDPQLSPTYLMVDALDECSKVVDDGAKVGNLKALISESLGLTDKVRWLITSRPEVCLNKDLEDFAPGTLAQIDVQGRGDAVQVYINHKLSDLRRTDGYSEQIINDLSRELNSRANNIFLWVALVFRELPYWDPWEAKDLLTGLPDDLTKLYDNLMAKIEGERESTAQFCKNVLVATCLAHRPLSTDELGVCAGLPSQVPASSIARKCGSFLAVRDNAVYPIHQSARDYLNDNYMTRAPGLARGHAEIFQRSIHQMTANLKANMYGLEPDTLSEDAKPPSKDQLASIRYSCEYWVDHFCEIDSQILKDGSHLSDNGMVFIFLRNHLLHWLESLSLIRNFSAAVKSIKKLLSFTQSNQSNSLELVALLEDAEKFSFRFRPIIEGAPLQIYAVALVLCPSKSKIKELYWKERSPFIKSVAGLKDNWDPCLQTVDHGLPADIYMTHVTFSPDGKTLAVGSPFNVRLWDTATGFCKKEIEVEWSRPGFSLDSKTLTLVSERGYFQIWDLTTVASNVLPDKTGMLWRDFSELECIAILPDGWTIARGLIDGTLEFWDAMTGTSKKTTEGHCDGVSFIESSFDGKRLVSGRRNHSLLVWDTATATCRGVFGHPDDWEVNWATMSPDGKTLASSSFRGVLLWDIDNGNCKTLFEGRHSGFRVAFSPDGQTIASDNFDVIKLFNAVTGVCFKSLKGHTREINSLAYSPDSQTLASASSDCKGRVWDATITSPDQSVEATAEKFRCLALSQDGKTIALGTESDVQLRDAATGVCTRTLQIDSPGTMAFSPDGKTFVTSQFHYIEIWDLATGDRIHKLEGPPAYNLAFSFDGKLLAAASFLTSSPNYVLLFDVATGETVQTFDCPKLGFAFAGALAVSPDNKTVASVSSGLWLWDVATGARKDIPFVLGRHPQKIRYTEDGRYLVTSQGWVDSNSGTPVPVGALQRRPTGLFFVEGEWVTRDGQKVFWLPTEYKNQHWDTSNSGVAFTNLLDQAPVLEFV